MAAVRATRMPMIITNPRLPDNPVVFANDAFCRLTGYPRDEILGRNCRFLQGPATDPATVAQIRAAVDKPERIEIDIQNHRKDGSVFWNRLLMAPVHDEAGELAYFFASQVDVTLERERLAGLESHNAALMTEVADRLRAQDTEAGRLGVWEVALPNFELTTSPLFRTLLGWPANRDLSWQQLESLIDGDNRPARLAAIRHTLETGADTGSSIALPGWTALSDGCRCGAR